MNKNEIRILSAITLADNGATLLEICEALGHSRIKVSTRRKVNELCKKGLIELGGDTYILTMQGEEALHDSLDAEAADVEVEATEDVVVVADPLDDLPTSDPDEPEQDEPEPVAEDEPEFAGPDPEPEAGEAEQAYPMVARTLWASDDETLNFDGYVEETRSDSVRSDAILAKSMDDRLGLLQGELLYEIKAGEYWQEWGFEEFSAYVESELGYKSRKATYMIDIYAKFVVELGLPIEKLKALEWSKAKEVLTIINSDNADEVIGMLGGSTFNEVRTYARAKRGPKSGGSGSGSAKFTRMSFNMSTDQAETVESALSMAKDIVGEETSRALEAIAAEFIAGRLDVDPSLHKDMRLDTIISSLNRAFGCELVDEA